MEQEQTNNNDPGLQLLKELLQAESTKTKK